MYAREKAILMEKTREMYKRFGIFKDHISGWGDPVEVLQAFEAYHQDDGTRNSSIYPHWLKDNKTRLKITFKIRSLSGTSLPYNVPVLYSVIDYQQEPYLVDFLKRPKTKTAQDDFNWLNEIDDPTHQEILIRLWSENKLQNYTEKEKKIGKLNSIYRINRKYIRSKRTPLVC